MCQNKIIRFRWIQYLQTKTTKSLDSVSPKQNWLKLANYFQAPRVPPAFISQTSESSTKPAASSRFFASATLDTARSKQASDLLIPGPLNNHYFDLCLHYPFWPASFHPQPQGTYPFHQKPTASDTESNLTSRFQPGCHSHPIIPWSFRAMAVPGHGMRRRPRPPHEVQKVLGGVGGRRASDEGPPLTRLRL